MKNIKTIEELFFTPVVSKFNAISEDSNIVKTDDYKLVSFEKNFLGIKKNDYCESSEIFLLTHKDVFELTKSLFSALSESEPQVLNYFHSEEMDWVAFLFNSSVYSSGMRRSNEDKKMPSGIDFVIGVNSGYGETDTPTFYLMLKHQQGGQVSFLTIDNYKFTKSEIEQYILGGRDFDFLQEILIKDVSAHFRLELDSFILLYEKLRSIRIEKSFFAPVCLDLYNLNRSLTSIKNDGRLRLNLTRLINQSSVFVKNLTLEITASDFIDFIIRYNYFSLENITLSREKIEDLFVKKRAYQKVEDMFPGFFKSQENFDEYLIEQSRTFDRIMREIN
jgi:hypothetical protein